MTWGGSRKLRDRGIEEWEAYEVWLNQHVTVRNKRNRAASHRLIGLTDSGRMLTILVRADEDGRAWLIVNGWGASKAERTLYERGMS